MISSCCFLYALRRWRLISFNAGESMMVSDHKVVLVPLETLMHTLPLAFAYLLYMVGILVPLFGCSHYTGMSDCALVSSDLG